MTRQQKVVLGGLGGVVAVLLLVVLLLNLGGDGKKVSAGSSTSSSTTEGTTTTSTADLMPAQTSSTTAKPLPSTTSSPPTTAAPQPVVDGSGAVLAAPPAPDTRTMSGADCRSLALGGPGWTSDCGTLLAKGSVNLAWLVERRSSPNGTRSAVLRQAGGNQWKVILLADDPGGTRFSAVSVALADASGDGKLDIGFGFRRVGSSQTLAVDVVEGPSQVVVHRDLAQGSARISSGQLNTWATDPADPSHVIKQVIRYLNGAWRIASSSSEAGPAPTSQL